MRKRQYQNWLREFCNLFLNTEVSQEYAIWSGIWTIGSVLQDNVSYPWGAGELWPNIYCWLIGAPASGKSTAGEIGFNMLRNLRLIDSFSGEITRSKLISRLVDISHQRSVVSSSKSRPCLALFSDELGITVGSGESAADFLRLLTVLYQGVYESDTHLRGTRSFKEKIVLSWLACTTPRWLQRSVPPDLVDSGTIARVIAVSAKISTKAFPKLRFDENKIKSLNADLAEISFLRGEYKLTPSAERFHDDWYVKLKNERSATQDPIIQGIYGREDEHVLKTAMCLTASASDDFEINEIALQHSINLVMRAKTSSVNLFRRLAVGDSLVDMKEYLLSKILILGPVQHTMLLRETSNAIPSNKVFAQLISTLYAEKQIEIVRKNNEVLYKPIVQPST